MFRNKIYKRFKKIHDYITDDKCKFTRKFDGVAYKYKTFKTKLGDRNIISSLMYDDTVLLGYHDYDDSILFLLAVTKNGKIRVVFSTIDDIAIFSAIYELECIIHDYKVKKRDNFLEEMFSYYCPMVGFSCAGLRYIYPSRRKDGNN